MFPPAAGYKRGMAKALKDGLRQKVILSSGLFLLPAYEIRPNRCAPVWSHKITKERRGTKHAAGLPKLWLKISRG
jgi:hypothetical protein